LNGEGKLKAFEKRALKKYLDVRRRKWKETWEGYIMSIFLV
jgi:hypothetical protein